MHCAFFSKFFNKTIEILAEEERLKRNSGTASSKHWFGPWLTLSVKYGPNRRNTGSNILFQILNKASIWYHKFKHKINGYPSVFDNPLFYFRTNHCFEANTHLRVHFVFWDSSLFGSKRTLWAHVGFWSM